ncbi:MAG: type II toxin-antitoxin system Phd/YefM family antitoxin [Armatimonadetes bacterium]|nr:type II toxin-antitoxin system Phd/YefM family antitoxin [Armatimonadota bacterium]
MIYSIADAKRQFSELVKRAAYKGETVAIGSRGRPEAALISVEELRRLRELEMERDARLLERAVRESGGTMEVGELIRAWHDTQVSTPEPKSLSTGTRYSSGHRAVTDEKPRGRRKAGRRRTPSKGHR